MSLLCCWCSLSTSDSVMPYFPHLLNSCLLQNSAPPLASSTSPHLGKWLFSWSHSILHIPKFFLCLSPYVLGWLSTSILDSMRWWPDICVATWVLSNKESLWINTNHLHLFIVFTSFQGALISIVCLILKIVLEGGIISVLFMKNQAHRVELPKNAHSNIIIPDKVTYAFILCQQLHS